jgi:hypothetical protein
MVRSGSSIDLQYLTGRRVAIDESEIVSVSWNQVTRRVDIRLVDGCLVHRPAAQVE